MVSCSLVYDSPLCKSANDLILSRWGGLNGHGRQIHYLTWPGVECMVEPTEMQWALNKESVVGGSKALVVAR